MMSTRRLADSEAMTRLAHKMLTETQTELEVVKGAQDRKRSAESDEMEIILEDLDRANQVCRI